MPTYHGIPRVPRRRPAGARARRVAAVVLLLLLLLPGPACKRDATAGRRTIVVGMDGMDPQLCERLMAEGRLPNLRRLREAGGYSPLATVMPPQSPVAWASFITGANPGVHGIFDFIHRDPSGQYDLYMGQARTQGGEEGWEVGEYRVPLTFWPFNHEPEQTVLRRDGTPFWDRLDAAGIPVWLYDIPANYPPSRSGHGHMCCLSGMGVPDLLGTYGTYQYFSEDTWFPSSEGGGRRSPLTFDGDRARIELLGPRNTARKQPKDTTVALDIYRHPTADSARIDVQGRSIVLTRGEWSDWVPVSFELRMPSFMPDQSVSGICRFFLKDVRPTFRLYVSPLNIDPARPGSQRVTEPPGFVQDLAADLGYFSTLGFQEDHKALSNGVFDDGEYHQQAEFVLEERLRLLDRALDDYEDGLLFFYVSSTDLQAHMFWWTGDDPHPVRDAATARRYHQVIERLYERMDALMGRLLQRFGEQATVILMSDHGFANFRRQFHLNTWLRREGYIHPPDCRALSGAEVDWSTTTAYGIGLNGLCLNLQGRERDGIVAPERRDALLRELADKLLAVRDPQNGAPVVARVYRADEIYTGPHVAAAPDLLIGYHRGYRASWATTLGNMPDHILSDNDSAWSADHCIAVEQVPGVVFANRRIRRADPAIVDVAPTVLKTFGVQPPEAMEGASLFEPRPARQAGSQPAQQTEDHTHGQDQAG